MILEIIRLTINPEDQKERIRKIYPDNFEDHYRNMGHNSEKANLDLSRRDVILDINTSEENYDQIKHKLYLLIAKSN